MHPSGQGEGRGGGVHRLAGVAAADSPVASAVAAAPQREVAAGKGAWRVRLAALVAAAGAREVKGRRPLAAGPPQRGGAARAVAAAAAGAMPPDAAHAGTPPPLLPRQADPRTRVGGAEGRGGGAGARPRQPRPVVPLLHRVAVGEGVAGRGEEGLVRLPASRVGQIIRVGAGRL